MKTEPSPDGLDSFSAFERVVFGNWESWVRIYLVGEAELVRLACPMWVRCSALYVTHNPTFDIFSSSKKADGIKVLI